MVCVWNEIGELFALATTDLFCIAFLYVSPGANSGDHLKNERRYECYHQNARPYKEEHDCSMWGGGLNLGS